MKQKLGWAILIAWIGWWTYFVVAAGIGSGDTKEAAQRIALFILIFGTGAAVSVRWPRIGGAILVATGAGLATVIAGYLPNPPQTTLFLLGTMALPPVAAGLLLRAREEKLGAPGG